MVRGLYTSNRGEERGKRGGEENKREKKRGGEEKRGHKWQEAGDLGSVIGRKEKR